MRRAIDLIADDQVHTVTLDDATDDGGSTITFADRTMAIALERWQGLGTPAAAGGGGGGGGRVFIQIDGRKIEAWVVPLPGGAYQVAGPGWTLEIGTRAAGRARPAAGAGQGTIGPVRSPITGKLVKVLVEVGQDVTAGQPLAVVEAMKMENEIRAPAAGRVKRIDAIAGQSVELGQVLLEIGRAENGGDTPAKEG